MSAKQARELARVIKSRQATKEQVIEFKELLPNVWRSLMDITKQNENQVIGLIMGDVEGQAVERLVMQQNIVELKKGLGYNEASTLERLMIDQIALAWLRLQVFDYQSSGAQDRSLQKHLDQRAQVAHSRFTKACAGLAKIRKMMIQTPALQINIANQQVVTG